MITELVVTIETHLEPETQSGRESLAGVARDELRVRLERAPLAVGAVRDVGWISVTEQERT
jgi:hypothetical protein